MGKPSHKFHLFIWAKSFCANGQAEKRLLKVMTCFGKAAMPTNAGGLDKSSHDFSEMFKINQV